MKNSTLTINEATLEQLSQLLEKYAQDGFHQVFIHAQRDDHGHINKIKKSAAIQPEELFHLFSDMECGDIILCYHAPGPLNTKEYHLDFATHLSHQGIGFSLVNKQGKLRILGEPAPTAHAIKPLDIHNIAQVLKEGGALNAHTAHYEVRDQQIAMLEFIAQSFNDNSVAIAEGSTGVGKSFAYLIPAIQWAAQNPQRIVISTATIALQQQLLKKDIPFVKKLLSATHIKAALVKGRRNYLCLHYFEEVLAEEKLLFKEDDVLLKIEEWALETKTGDKSEMPFLPKEELWSRMSCDAESCLASQCPYFQKCFVFRARKLASTAQILVVNHHLFFADLVIRSEVENANLCILPPFHKIIFDEAHQVESSAIHFFSESFSFYSIQRNLSRLLRRKGNKEGGLLMQVEQELPSSEYHRNLLDQTHKSFQATLQSNQNLYELHAHFYEPSLRLCQKMPQTVQKQFLEPLRKLQAGTSSLFLCLEKLLDILSEISQHVEVVHELSLVCKKFKTLSSLLELFIHFQEHSSYIFWAAQRNTRIEQRFYTYTMTPLDIGALLCKFLYQKKLSLIMTSATLTFNNNFNYFLEKMGLNTTEIPQECVHFSSPFHYDENVLFLIPEDLATVENEQNYIHQSHTLILDIVKKNPTKGTLILFTSYSALKQCAEFLLHALGKESSRLMKQGDHDRQELIDRFLHKKNAILLGTDSFWEGIDLSDNILQILIIMKLPFSPPNNPLFQAKQELYEQRGLNPFMELQVPEAAIKLKQGFGRLMRKSTDIGCILLLDNRVIKKRYGELFLKTLPAKNLTKKKSSEIAEAIYSFLS